MTFYIRPHFLAMLLLVIVGSCWGLADKKKDSYDWEDLDYYAILGLDSGKRNSYDSKTIKKSYRKQAQKWHPDKHQSSVSLPESEARFSRIAEAYEVLSNEEQRSQYDVRLVYLKRQRGEIDGSWWNADFDLVFSHYCVKPVKRFFEDLLKETVNETIYDHDSSFDGESPFPLHSETPDRVYEEHETLTSPWSGDEILRVLQKEEYYHHRSVFYRIVKQDFVERWDPYNYQHVFQPLQVEPVTVEWGYIQPKNSALENERRSHSILWPDATMIAKSTLGKGSYEVRLSSRCELTIVYHVLPGMNRHSRDQKQILWTSSTELLYPIIANNDCQLKLRGSHLVLTAGDPEELLWFSSSEAEDGNDLFVSRLDGDGSLAVYRLEPVKLENSWLSSLWEMTVVEFDRSNGVLVQFSLFFRSMWSVFRFQGRPLFHVGHGEIAVGECVSAVGSPFGCNRLGRKALQAFRMVKHLLLSFNGLFER